MGLSLGLAGTRRAIAAVWRLENMVDPGRRGFGKTRAGSEWVRAVAEAFPEARIALVAATLSEARAVMVEGESGIIACCAPESRPVFEASLRRLRFPNGAQALIYSAQEPESLRGPQHSHACRPSTERVLHQSCIQHH
jgi:phage terminase large subunit-like protein